VIVPIPEPESLTEAEYDKRFQPFGNPADNDNDIWEHRHTLTQPTENVWSVLEVDDDLYAIPGYHVVNVIGYNVTKQPWPHEDIEVRFDNPHDDHDSDCKDGDEDCVI